MAAEQSPIVPVAKSIYLCDYVIGSDRGKVDLYGVFNAIRPEGYPYSRTRMCLFTRLSNGLGTMPFHFDIRSLRDGAMVHATETQSLHFAHKWQVIGVAMSVVGCSFDRPGVYSVDLFCHNSWVCDTTFELLPA